MLGALGALVPELIERSSSYRFLDPVWWSVGYTKLQVRRTAQAVPISVTCAAICNGLNHSCDMALARAI